MPNQPDIRTLPATALRRRFAAARSGRLVLTRLVRATLIEALAAIRADSEPPIDGNIRTFWYRWLKPVLARLNPDEVGRKDPYDVLVRELSQMVGSERRFDYADFGFVDDNWENRRIGVGRPQVIVFAEKAGWFRLLRRLHTTHDVTVLALGGKPSLLTSEYTARHVSAAMARAGIDGPVWLLGLVDWDPDGAIIAQAFADQLRSFDVEVGGLELLVRPEQFDDAALALFARVIPDGRRTRRWLAEGGGIRGRAQVLSAEAMPAAQAEELAAAAIARLAPEIATAVTASQSVEVLAWSGEIGPEGSPRTATLELRQLAAPTKLAVARARLGEPTVVTERGVAAAALVPVSAARRDG